MRHRSLLRNTLEYCVAMVALQSLQWTPRKLSFWLARIYIRMLDLAIPRLRQVARRNLTMALPEYTPERHAQIVDGVFPLPPGPGLGVEIDDDALDHYRVA